MESAIAPTLIQFYPGHRAIRARLEEMAAVLAAISDLVMVHSLQGQVLYANPAAVACLGWDPQGSQADAWLQKVDLRHLDGRPASAEDFSQQLSRRQALPLLISDAAGKTRSLSASAAAFIVDGQPAGVVTIWQDQTPQQEAELRLSYQARLLENASEAIIAMDRAFVVQAWNPAAEALLGWKAEEVVGRRDLSLLQPNFSGASFSEVVQQARQTGQWRGEGTQLRKDGIRITVDITAMALFDTAGQLSGFVGLVRSANERKRSQAALRASAVQIEDLYNRAPCGYHSLDADGVIVRANDTELDWLGYTRQQILGKRTFAELLTDDSRGEFEADFEDFKRHGRMNNLEYEMVCKNGSILPVLVNATLIRDAFGNYVTSRFSLFDIREYREARMALSESEARFRRLAENASDAIFRYRVTAASGFEYVSPAVIAMSGYTPEEFYADPDLGFKIIHPDDQPAFNEMMNRLDFMPTTFTARWLRKDGRVMWSEQRIVPVFDESGRLVALEGIARDITERKQAEEQLQKLSLAVEQSHSMVVITDLDGRVDYANPAFTATTGYSLAEAATKNLDDLTRSDQHSAQVYHDMWQAVLGGNNWRGEIISRKKSGELYWEMATISPIKNQQGQIVQIIKVAEDTTARVQAEDEMRRQRDRLATLLAVSQTIASTLELEPLLNLILEQLAGVLPYTSALILSLEGDQAVFQAYRGARNIYTVKGQHFTLQDIPTLQQAILAQQEIYIPDAEQVPGLVLSACLALNRPVETIGQYRTWFGLPLVVKKHALGMLMLLHSGVDFYPPAERSLAQAFANQAALAIENARLFQEAGQAAAQAERARLASDLHDAVTQTLFSANLIAESLPRLWPQDPQSALQGLEELRLLTRSALAEMRTLLWELRPAYLVEKPLGELLRTLAQTMSSRSGIPIEVSIQGSSPRLPDLQMALYRITQEALNNVLRHSGASQVEIRLEGRPQHGTLHIRDDGRGFDPALVDSGKRGMGSMRERARSIGAELEISSRPGKGTQIWLRWQTG